MVRLQLGREDLCWIFSIRNNRVSVRGSFGELLPIIGCRAATTSTTFARRAVTRVSTAASAPVAFVGGLATFATTIPNNPYSPRSDADGVVRHVRQTTHTTNDHNGDEQAGQERRSLRGRRRCLFRKPRTGDNSQYDSDRCSDLHEPDYEFGARVAWFRPSSSPVRDRSFPRRLHDAAGRPFGDRREAST